jgi:hypothetical protein
MKQRYKKFDCVKYYSIACCLIKIRFIFAQTLTPKQMETAIIIVLAFMLLISVIILIDIKFDYKALNIKIQVCESLLDKSKIENEKLKSKNEKSNKENKYLISNNENLKIRNDEQEQKIYKLKLSINDYSDSKINQLETKYQSALKKIVERDEVIRLRNNEILKYDKCNKQIADELIKKDNIIQDSYIRIKNMEQEKQLAINQRNNANEEKQFAIHQSNKAMHMANDMVKDLIYLNSQIESLELELKRKLKS